jgi:hypothetical protein
MPPKGGDKAAAHELAVRLVTENLAKREPISSCVLAWGWLLKQVRGARARRAAPAAC